MADPILRLNGQNIEDLNLRMTSLGDAYSGLAYDRAAPQGFGQAGGYPMGEATVSPRVLTFTTSLDATVSNRRSRLDVVRRHLKGMVQVTLEDDDTRVIYGRVERSPGRPRFPSVAWVEDSADTTLELEITCYNPLWQDKEGRVVAIDSTARGAPLGTSVSAPVVKIKDSAANPKLIYRDMRGEELASMDFNGTTLASNEVLEIDMRTQRIVKVTDGSTRADALSTLDSGWFFWLDPGDGGRDGAPWPTLEVDSGSAVAEYRRWWE